MAKITRFNGNLVAPASAALGTERTLFGDVTQSDDLTDQFTADLLRGWGIVGPSDQPTLQDFNAMGFTLGQIHAYLHQMGVAEYNATQEYHLGSIANDAGVLYVSLVDTNVGNDPALSPLQWSPQSEHGMVVFDTAGVTVWPVPLAMQLGIIKPKVTVTGGGGTVGTISSSAQSTTFGIYMTGQGGASVAGTSLNGANGGVATGGDLNIPGGNGGGAVTISGITVGGSGGGSHWGSSGETRSGTAYGAGVGGTHGASGCAGAGAGATAIGVIDLTGITTVTITVGAGGLNSLGGSGGGGLAIIEW